MKFLVELGRAHKEVWINPDQIVWCEPAGSGTKIHFADGQDLTVDQSPDDIDILCTTARNKVGSARAKKG
jgi:hypothetical protein